MNLLTASLIAVSDGEKLSLPGLLAALARDEVRGFPAMRPHQRAAWHMFLVQLAALAAWKAGWSELPDDPAPWADAIRRLSPDWTDDEPWRLVVPDRTRPAFMQAPDPGALKWEPVATPDALDLLVASKNHDHKRTVMWEAEPQDWIFALVSLQTADGYIGKFNYGIARMNGGYGSRPMVSLANGRAGEPKSTAVPVSAWWRRDASRLLRARVYESNRKPHIGQVGGTPILWTLGWPEREQLSLDDMDPLFIEICRRVRFSESNGVISASRANSRLARCNANTKEIDLKGHTGDPWAPVSKGGEKDACLSIGAGGFNYRKLCELLFSGDWTTPYYSDHGESESDGAGLLLVAEALARGQGKTQGFKSRVVHIPDRARGFLKSKQCGDVAKAQIEEIKAFDGALRYALAVASAGGEPGKVSKKHYQCAATAQGRFDQKADRIFFRSLWRRMDARTDGAEAVANAKLEFLQALHDAAKTELESALPTVPCASIQRPRAEYRARAIFRSKLRANSACDELFVSEMNND